MHALLSHVMKTEGRRGVKLLVHLFIIYYFLLNKGQGVCTTWPAEHCPHLNKAEHHQKREHIQITRVFICVVGCFSRGLPQVETQSLLKSWILAIVINDPPNKYCDKFNAALIVETRDMLHIQIHHLIFIIDILYTLLFNSCFAMWYNL